MKAALFFDGGSFSTCKGDAAHRPASYGFVIYMPHGPYWAEGHLLPPGATNNFAEFTGLIEGLKALKAAGAKEALVVGDSQFVVRAFTGEYRVKVPALKQLLGEARKAAEGMTLEVKWQRRNNNSIADGMCRKAVEAGNSVKEIFDVKTSYISC